VKKDLEVQLSKVVYEIEKLNVEKMRLGFKDRPEWYLLASMAKQGTKHMAAMKVVREKTRGIVYPMQPENIESAVDSVFYKGDFSITYLGWASARHDHITKKIAMNQLEAVENEREKVKLVALLQSGDLECSNLPLPAGWEKD
jgi:hypothetical protein